MNAMVRAGPGIRHVAAIALVIGTTPLNGHASEVETCRAAIMKGGAVEVRGSPTVLTLGERRVVVGNTEGAGFLCALGGGAKAAVSDVVTGLDSVGTIASAKRIDVPPNTFVATVQAFRGGSNAMRQMNVIYRIDGGKIRKVLELPARKELAIGEFRLAERNQLRSRQSALQVEQELSVRRADSGRDGVLYRTARSFALTFMPEFSAFVEGAGTCLQDVTINREVWLKKGQRFGYIFHPGLADAASLTVRLVRQDGSTASLEDLAELVFVHVDAE